MQINIAVAQEGGKSFIIQLLYSTLRGSRKRSWSPVLYSSTRNTLVSFFFFPSGGMSCEQQLRALLSARLAGKDNNVTHMKPFAPFHAAMSSTSNSVNESRATSVAHWQPAARNSHAVSSHIGAAGSPSMPVIAGSCGTDGPGLTTFTDLLCGGSAKHDNFAAGIPTLDDCFGSDAPFEGDSDCVLTQPADVAEKTLPLPSSHDPLHINPEYLQELADFAESLKGQGGSSTHASTGLPSAQGVGKAHASPSAAGMLPTLSNVGGAGAPHSEIGDLPLPVGSLQQSLIRHFLAAQRANALRAAQRPAAAALASDRLAAELAVQTAMQARGVGNAPPFAVALANGLGERLGSGTGSVSGDLQVGGDMVAGAAEGVWDSPQGDAGEGGAHWSSDESRPHGRMDVLKLKPRSLKERARRERIR